MKTSWVKISLFFLFLVAFIGTSLRAIFFIPLPLLYKNLVHAHSHIAFQGWIYTLMFLLITNLFLKEEEIRKGRYPLQFKLTVVIIIGVLISFSLQGYRFYSILFSSLFQLMNYWFIFSFFRNTKKRGNDVKTSISFRFVKTGLWLALLSTLMPWGIGILSAKGLNGSEIYHSFIYAFLHFQYNGWFLFVAIGLLFKCFENNKILYNKKRALKFYWLFTLAVIPALSLSLLGMSFKKFMVLPAHLAGSLQLVGSLFFFLILKTALSQWFQDKKTIFKLFVMVFIVSFFLKIILQYLSVFPIFDEYAFHNKHIVLAYLHLSLIGVITFFLLAILMELKWLRVNRFNKTGNIFLLLGFILTELILVLSGLSIFYNQELLFIGSAAMAIGILLLLFSPQKTDSHEDI